MNIEVTEVQQSGTTVYQYMVWDPNTREVAAAGQSKNLEAIKKEVKNLEKKYPDSKIIDESGALTEEKKAPADKRQEEQLIPPLKMGQFGSQTDQDIRAFDAAAKSTFGSGGTSGFGTPSLSLDLDKLTKKTRDTSGMSEKRRKEYESLTEKQKSEKKCSGVFGTKRLQAMAARENTPSEIEVARGIDNNAYIVIGNDRVGKPHTGYGGKGHTQCDSIDIVAGVGGAFPREVEKIRTESGDVVESPVKTNPNFYVDAARIYISQKTDVDKNFGLCEFAKKQNGYQDDKDDDEIGKYGAKSAVAVKADNVRLIGRESIRIVTGTDAKNSQSGATRSKCGVEIVAMNEVEKLQPMVLGDNLVEALTKLLDRINAIEGYINAFRDYQMEFNRITTNHTHLSPFFVTPTLQGITMPAAGFKMEIDNVTKTERSAMANTINMAGFKKNYLTPGNKYINSTLNKVN
ncbi:MAG: hypothetical protein CML45_03740 [Rhodobacteraceae bacterium]|nr:hypothetical protein [Paracoccaceae bacterium]|tara:strand:+ start:1969 stop:3348 length:1380 start_codon:yes stop_codon:yes gene_type:complete